MGHEALSSPLFKLNDRRRCRASGKSALDRDSLRLWLLEWGIQRVFHPALSRDRKVDWGDDGKTRELLPFLVPSVEKMSIAVLQKQYSGIGLLASDS